MDYLWAAFGGAQGWLFVGIGIAPYRNARGKIRFAQWVEGCLAWPGEDRELLELLLKNSGAHDCYLCPYLMSEPRRKKHTSAAPALVHADVDRGRLNTSSVRNVPGAFAVSSGSPGNGHVYVRLTRPVPHHQHEQLCRGLMAHSGATDSKVSDNDMLRPPGTHNHKPTIDGGEPVPVTWAVAPDGVRIDPEELADLLGVELTDTSPGRVRKSRHENTPTARGAAVIGQAAPFNPKYFPAVRRALGKNSGDRSSDTMRVVRACLSSGLTEAHARWVVQQRDDLATRLNQRHDDDVARCWRVCLEKP
ncbi:DNA-primase RepB domain-containing protein [Mycobacterium sp. GA-1199]|uniref:DNA-primase RepB domain-containing protein n=1 Tax=Mycobacterium sp. GA-1199 TaxID=1772287 RepID=UPI0018D23EB2|nr:DNA-primase RepB domain-containing protein [Mycobacterium sp. GA-1199]